MLKISLIGLGGISQCILENQQANGREAFKVISILVRDREHSLKMLKDYPDTIVCDSVEELLATGPDFVAECAGHQAVYDHGEAILASGTSLIVISVGALADEALYTRLVDVAEKEGAQIFLPAGAVGAIDALSSAEIGGLNSVRYRARKPAKSWAGTPASREFDLDKLTSEAVIFRGYAREAAQLYPKNSNVAATVALAGLGFDKTEVELIADPNATENFHQIDVDGIAGKFSISLCGYPSSSNPKTSALTAYSVLKCIRAQRSAIVI